MRVLPKFSKQSVLSRAVRAPAILSLCAGLLFSAASSADVYEASFEGNWYNPSQSGRGASVDYVPQALGNGTYFILTFTYDGQGNPTWLQYQASGREGQRLFKNVDVFRVSGGAPGNTFPAFSALSIVKVGTATVDLASCAKMTLDFTPASTSTIPAVSQTLTRLDGGSTDCPFTREFTGCPAGTTAVAGADRVCELPGGVIAGDLRLTNSASYQLGGRVAIGGAMTAATGAVAANTGRLFVEPGTIVRGNDSTASRLIINPGSKIFAEGTPVAPIVFTGNVEIPDERQSPGAWAGLILAGRAPINAACRGGQTAGACSFEADAAVVWGGAEANDSSGTLKYVQIRSAGGIVSGTNDLNALTLGAVGAGTLIDFVQTYRSTDDGFEMFGGTVNLKHIVALGNNDDNIDTDFGYRGKIQYAYVKIGTGFDAADSHGIESDNTADAAVLPDAAPRTRPVLINATLDGAGNGVDGIRVRRGSGFALQNVVISGFRTCVNINDKVTYDATFANGAANGTTAISGSVFSCVRAFDDEATQPFLVSTFVNGQPENSTPANLDGLFNGDGRTLQPMSPLRSSMQLSTDSFFEPNASKGAFVDGDWTKGWTIGM